MPQFMQSLAWPLAVALEYFPARQSSHVDAAVAASVVEYLPCAQGEQAVEPFTGLYLPATQPIHEPPSGPVKPGAQTHITLPSKLLELLGQSEHECEPDMFLNVPAGHGVQDPAGPVSPALQIIEVDGGAAVGVGVVVEGSGVVVVTHGDDPLTSLYEPTSHTLHSPPSGPE